MRNTVRTIVLILVGLLCHRVSGYCYPGQPCPPCIGCNIRVQPYQPFQNYQPNSSPYPSPSPPSYSPYNPYQPQPSTYPSPSPPSSYPQPSPYPSSLPPSYSPYNPQSRIQTPNTQQRSNPNAQVRNFNCNNIKNAVGFGQMNTCLCRKGYYWNGINCVVNCNIPNSNGAFNATQCNCIQNSYWNGQSCALRCQNLPNAQGYDYAALGSCKCAERYEWTGKSCEIKCSIIQFSNGRRDASTCNCADGYDWVNNSCVSSHCKKVPYSTGRQASASSCECNQGFLWSSNGLCVIDCTRIPNSTGAVTTTTSCQCYPNFTWQNNACTYTGINCSKIQFSTGKQSTYESCQCSSGYTWLNNACRIDCSRLPNTRNLAHDGTCECLQGFAWNAQEGCVRVFDCSKVLNSIQGQQTARECQCSQGYLWERTTGLCVVDCERLPNCNGRVNATVCSCVRGYWWSGRECVGAVFQNLSQYRLHARLQNQGKPASQVKVQTNFAPTVYLQGIRPMRVQTNYPHQVQFMQSRQVQQKQQNKSQKIQCKPGYVWMGVQMGCQIHSRFYNSQNKSFLSYYGTSNKKKK